MAHCVRNIICLARRSVFTSSRLCNINKSESKQDDSEVVLVDNVDDPDEMAVREEKLARLRNKSRLQGENYFI